MSRVTNSTVKEWLEERGEMPPFTPMARYDPAGDCIEFMLSNKAHYGKRLDGWVTVYYSEEDDEIVGGLIKGVRSSLLERFPGLKIEIEGNQLRVVFLLRLTAWQSGDSVKQAAYKAVIDKIDTLELEAEITPA